MTNRSRSFGDDCNAFNASKTGTKKPPEAAVVTVRATSCSNYKVQSYAEDESGH